MVLSIEHAHKKVQEDEQRDKDLKRARINRYPQDFAQSLKLLHF
jgi:hypothetical protein